VEAAWTVTVDLDAAAVAGRQTMALRTRPQSNNRGCGRRAATPELEERQRIQGCHELLDLGCIALIQGRWLMIDDIGQLTQPGNGRVNLRRWSWGIK
jgi:hypothetical protein